MNAVHDGRERALPEQLANIDLNLMVAFDALVRELSVTRAAERVGVTQSAMSHALGRLRGLFGDPLLVRGRAGMLLTPRAEALTVPVRSALVTIGRVLVQPGSFEPHSARRAFRLTSPDLFDVVVIPHLLARMRADAPGVDLAVVGPSGQRLADRLETGELDVAVTVQADESKPAREALPGLVRRKLFSDRWVCLLRADHPAISGKQKRRGAQKARSPLSLTTYATLSHAMVSPTGEGPGLVDDALAERGLTRRVALSIPHFYSALAIVARSDLVLTAPSALAHLAKDDPSLVAVPAPLPLPTHGVYLVWHERYANDTGHAWLRGLVAEVAQSTQKRAPPLT